MNPHNEAVLRAQQRIEATQRAREFIKGRGEDLEDLDPRLIAQQLGWYKAQNEADAAIDGYAREQWIG